MGLAACDRANAEASMKRQIAPETIIVRLSVYLFLLVLGKSASVFMARHHQKPAERNNLV
jgi:hypothetical protein